MGTDLFFSNRGGAHHLANRALDRRPCTKTGHASRVSSLLCETHPGGRFPVWLPGSESSHRGGFAGVDLPHPEHCAKALCGPVAVGAFLKGGHDV